MSILCACGCGEPSPPASRTDATRGYVKGEPVRFIRGHNWRGGPREDRFWSFVAKGEGCWEWLGKKGNGGYGHAWDGQAKRAAHRVAYQLTVGPIPEGLELDHLCRNTGCVRPDHLEPVTHLENMRRRYADYTHCIHGHEFTPENTYVERLGNGQQRRRCRACDRRRWAERAARKRARRDAS